MKVELIRIKFDDDASYKYKPLQYCCNEFRDNPCIELTRQEPTEYDETIEDDGEIVPYFAITKNDSWYDYGERWDDFEYYHMKFCPFCGEKIDIEVVGEEDRTDEYLQVNQQVKDLRNKHKKTDSKKKSEELCDQINRLINKVNWFHTLGEYKDEQI